jgi:dipeptidyl aminopeptidase/acylaminoacyl peptidase
MRSSVVLAAFIVALAVVQDGPKAEPESRDDGRISVIVGESGDVGPTPRLIVMDADGKDARVFDWMLHASLSPDGRLVAYEGRERIPTIRVMAIDRRGQDRLLVRNGMRADWSPTGRAIAFIRGSDLWVKDLPNGMQKRIVRNAEAPDWSWDGKKLAFVRRNDVWVVKLGSKRARPLIRDADAPRWSPDGSQIAFERHEWNKSHTDYVDTHIYIARADGAGQRRLVEAESPAWSPDGHEIAVSVFRRVIRIRVDGAHRRLVYAHDCCGYRDLDWVR